jgi:WD40 repeat protein
VRFDEGRSFMTGLRALTVALKADLEWLREHTRLFARATEWRDGGHVVSRLLRGSDVSAAKSWAARRPKDAPDLTPLHLDFIKASEEAELARVETERQQIEKTRRYQRWAFRGLLVVGVFVALGAVFTSYAYFRSSQREGRVMTSKARGALEQGKLALALRYAVAGLPPSGALPLDYWSADLESLMADIARRYTPLLSTRFGKRSSGIDPSDARELGAIDPSGARALVADPTGASIWSTTDGSILWQHTATPPELMEAWSFFAAPFANPFVRESRLVLSKQDSLLITDVEKRIVLGEHEGIGSGFNLTVDRSRSVLLATWVNRRARPEGSLVRAFSLQTGKAMPTLSVAREVNETKLSADGKAVIVRYQDGEADLLELGSGRRLARLNDPGEKVDNAAFDPDGKIAFASQGARGGLWDVANGQKLHSLQLGQPESGAPGQRFIRTGRFSLDGKYLFAISEEKEAPDDSIGSKEIFHVWRTADGQELSDIRRAGCDSFLAYGSSSSKWSRALVECGRSTLLIDPDARLFHEPDLRFGDVKVSPDGERLLSMGRLFDGKTGDRIADRLPWVASPAVFSDDGNYLATGTVAENDWVLANGRTGVQLGRISAIEAITRGRQQIGVSRGAFSPDSRLLVTRHDGAVVLREARTGREISRIIADPEWEPKVTTVRFAGLNRLVTIHRDDSVRLWDISSTDGLKAWPARSAPTAT